MEREGDKGERDKTHINRLAHKTPAFCLQPQWAVIALSSYTFSSIVFCHVVLESFNYNWFVALMSLVLFVVRRRHQ